MMLARAALVAALLTAGRPASAQDAPLPSSTLFARDTRGAWQEIWSSAHAPIAFGDTSLAQRIRWQPGAAGILWGELLLHGTGEAWRTRLIVARLDPSRVRLALDTAFTPGREAAWTLKRAPSTAVLAVNAGQFEATMPWGWVVLDGRRWLRPQTGPLSAALMQDAMGTLHWIKGADVFRVSAESRAVWAFQSYPAVLSADSVLPPVRSSGHGIDLAHRDARAGVCRTRDAQLLIAMTRFDAAGPGLGFIPFGLTVPEMTAILGELGCRDAMLLDGGISAKLRVRDAQGVAHDWDGLRPVPLGLLAFPKQR